MLRSSAVVWALVAGACGGGKTAQGELGGHCYPNGTCNVTLECIGGICTAPADGGEPEDASSDAWLLDATLDDATPADATPSDATPPDTRVLRVEMRPSPNLQIVVWLEDAAGAFIDTIMITDAVGRYGLCNRPGIMEFNSGPRWPHGRRTSTFPVWAHRHGQEYPLVVFQNQEDSNLSHPFAQSSLETYYCRPVRPDEPLWDAQTCATEVHTDKGKLSQAGVSLYPPRSDLTRTTADDATVAQFAAMNPFDAVSRATPIGDAAFVIDWPLPPSVVSGDYVLHVEASREFDMNAAYDYPAPSGIPWAEYGVAYRGQPSVVYRVPVQVGEQPTSATIDNYSGYGDPSGVDGVLRPPDSTITSNVPGSGAQRLLLADDGAGGFFRVRASVVEP